MLRLLNQAQDQIDALRRVDFIAPLALRLYLAPIFWVAGIEKLTGFDNIVQWFGNAHWGLGLPLPTVMAALATGAELLGALFLLIGFAVRWISIPLIITMLVAIVSVHATHGWQAIASGKAAFAAASLGPLQLEDAAPALNRLSQANALLREHGDYSWLTEAGGFVVLNNGAEFAATYLIMLLVLLFTGAGRWVSLDDWIARRFRLSKSSSA
jgi:uncharacterized membrane protein YphA (DoxX/SURF4 family)